MMALFVWLVWPDAEQQAHIKTALDALDFGEMAPYLGGHIVLVAITHFCRAWRWNNLLEPIGVRLKAGPLLAISSVGFMAILALPARLGEFVRPALIRKKGHISAAAALGTVAVERIIDGLLVSMFVFGALFALRGPNAPGWMMPTAYTALALFAAALTFLAFALRWPKKTVHISVGLTLAPVLAPKVAAKLEEALTSLISGFLVLKDKKNLIIFVLWTILYWTVNGLSLWVLAHGFGLELSLVGTFATVGLIAVGITLPNAPGLVGQYQHFTMLGLGLYLSQDIVQGPGFLFAIALHAIQVIWYMSIGFIALASKHVSFAEVAAARNLPDDMEHEA